MAMPVCLSEGRPWPLQCSSGSHKPSHEGADQLTVTPFQKAMRPRMHAASGFGSG